MKKLIVFTAVAALGVLASNAVPTTSWSGFYIKATMETQNEDRTKMFSFTTKDMLSLIQTEFPDTTIPDGARLVTRGSFASISDQFAVLTKVGDVVIDNASSTDSDSYKLYWQPNYSGYFVYNYLGDDKYNFTFTMGNFHYQDSTDTYNMYIGGVTHYSDNTQTDSESFNMPNGSGYYWLPSGEGIINPAKLSGSGKDVFIFSF